MCLHMRAEGTGQRAVKGGELQDEYIESGPPRRCLLTTKGEAAEGTLGRAIPPCDYEVRSHGHDHNACHRRITSAHGILYIPSV